MRKITNYAQIMHARSRIIPQSLIISVFKELQIL